MIVGILMILRASASATGICAIHIYVGLQSIGMSSALDSLECSSPGMRSDVELKYLITGMRLVEQCREARKRSPTPFGMSSPLEIHSVRGICTFRSPFLLFLIFTNSLLENQLESDQY